MQSNEIEYRPLGIVKTVLDGLGADVSYVYEDLVFVTHNHFLLQFGEIGSRLIFLKNDEIEDADSGLQFQELSEAARGVGIDLEYGGAYRLSENDDGTISIEFLEENEE